MSPDPAKQLADTICNLLHTERTVKDVTNPVVFTNKEGVLNVTDVLTGKRLYIKIGKVRG